MLHLQTIINAHQYQPRLTQLSLWFLPNKGNKYIFKLQSKQSQNYFFPFYSKLFFVFSHNNLAKDIKDWQKEIKLFSNFLSESWKKIAPFNSPIQTDINTLFWLWMTLLKPSKHFGVNLSQRNELGYEHLQFKFIPN